MQADAYTYTILLSVCSNLLPKDDKMTRLHHAQAFFQSCCESGHVNDYVLRKLRQTVTEEEYLALIEYRDASSLPLAWTRNARNSGGGNHHHNNHNNNHRNHYHTRGGGGGGGNRSRRGWTPRRHK